MVGALLRAGSKVRTKPEPATMYSKGEMFMISPPTGFHGEPSVALGSHGRVK